MCNGISVLLLGEVLEELRACVAPEVGRSSMTPLRCWARAHERKFKLKEFNPALNGEEPLSKGVNHVPRGKLVANKWVLAGVLSRSYIRVSANRWSDLSLKGSWPYNGLETCVWVEFTMSSTKIE